MLCALAAAGLSCGAGARATEPTLLDQFAKRWATIDDYTATIVAHEVDGTRTDDRTFRFWFRKPDHAKLEMTEGYDRGTVVLWTGGSRVHVHVAGLGLIPLSYGIHDSKVTSMRGNSIARPNLGPTIDCFEQHRDAVRAGSGPTIDGRATQTLTLEIDGGLGCPGEPAQDRDVTKDVLTMTRDDGFVVLRERYAGDSLVERWELRDLRVNVGLTDSDFR